MKFILFGLVSIIFSLGVHSFCYWIDGTLANGYSPCYALDSVGASMCCDESDGLKCLDSGLCQSTPVGPLGAHDKSSSYWRAACSDNTWQDGACLAMAPWITDQKAQLGVCADGSFCPRDIGGPNATCCNTNQGQKDSVGGAKIAASAVSSIQQAASRKTSTTTVATSAGGSTATTTTTTTATTTAASTQSATSTPNPSPKSSNKAWIAGAVLGPVAAIFFGFLTFFLVRQRAKQTRFDKGQATGHAASKNVAELEAHKTSELPG